MSTNNNGQLQIRIDPKIKAEAKKVFDSLGMDMSSAVKIFFQQAINAGTFPCELRDENGFTLRQAENLRKSCRDARRSKKTFKTGAALIADALKD
jgi:DNA-damage-inducible protein J